MPLTKHEPNRIELVKAGKLEERKSPRPSIIPAKEEEKTVADEAKLKLSREIIAIALMVIVLLVLTVLGSK